jgi:hypothetical protein
MSATPDCGGGLGLDGEVGKSKSCDEWLFPCARGPFDIPQLADGQGSDGLTALFQRVFQVAVHALYALII